MDKMEIKQKIKIDEKSKIAVVLVRGLIGVTKKIKDTIKMLNLHKKNNCVVFDYSAVKMGMVKKAKDYVTYGEIDADTLKLLKEKRGKEGKTTFQLNPPKKGFGRKGIKIAFSVGGALGYRGAKINDLIKRML